MIHNPGTVPEASLATPGADITTVVEESYAQYQSAWLQERLSSLHYDRTKCSFMVHSVPWDEVEQLVHHLRHRGEYVFVTDLSEHYYSRFGSSWGEFIKAMQME